MTASFLLAELLAQHALERVEADAHHAEGRADRQRVLGDFIARRCRPAWRRGADRVARRPLLFRA